MYQYVTCIHFTWSPKPFLFFITVNYIHLSPDLLYLWEDKIEILLTTSAFIIRLHLDFRTISNHVSTIYRLSTTITLMKPIPTSWRFPWDKSCGHQAALTSSLSRSMIYLLPHLLGSTCIQTAFKRKETIIKCNYTFRGWYNHKSLGFYIVTGLIQPTICEHIVTTQCIRPFIENIPWL